METPNPKKRRPILALLLSLMAPGLGQLYNGQIRRAGFLYLGGMLLTAVFFSGFYSKFHFLILFLVLGICYFLFALADALYQAVKIKAINLKKFNRWYLYIALALCHFLLVAFCIHNNFIPVKVYRIPTGSMAPTLLPGDYFFIDKTHYEKQKPQRGDIIVFESPADSSQDFIKRVVGLPGEAIRIHRNQVFINNQVIDEPYRFSRSQTNLLLGFDYRQLVVPPESVYVLGDNRSQSRDSRHYKSIKLSAVRGRALYLVWAEDRVRVGTSISR